MNLNEIMDDVVRAYGSLTEPRYHFVASRYGQRPYEPVIEDLARRFEIEETTDLNDDRAVFLHLKGNEIDFGLRLSLVGRYAVITSANGELLETEEMHRQAEVQAVVVALSDWGVLVLGRTELLTEVEFGDRGRLATLYELLISHDEGMFA